MTERSPEASYADRVRPLAQVPTGEWRTIRGLIERGAAFYSDHDAVVCDGVRLTYADYATRCRRLANALATRSVRKGDRVSILSTNSLEYVEYYGACEYAGFIAAPLNFRLVAPEIAATLQNVGADVLLFEAALESAVEGALSLLSSRPLLIRIGPAQDGRLDAIDYAEFLESGQDVVPAEALVPSDIAYLMSTSGTTGRPKAVVRSHRASTALVESLASDFHLPLNGTTLAMTPMFHVGGKDMRGSALWRSGKVVVMKSFDVAAVLRAITQERVNTMFLVATQLQTLLDAPDFAESDLSSLRAVCLAGAPCPAPLLARAIGAFGPIFCVQYGMTEGMIASMHSNEFGPRGAPALARRIASVGHSIPQGQIRIVRNDGSPASVGEPGEVCSRSEVMFEGYWNDEEASQAAMRDGWFHTGDIGFLDDQGYLFLVDRKKDMIVTGGENVYCREVEDALTAHPQVIDAAVIGIPDEKWGEAVMAFVILETDATVDAAELTAHCRRLIAGYKCPRRISLVQTLPQTPNGKIDKVAVRDLHATATRGKT